MPRPTRRRSRVEPAAGLIVFKRIVDLASAVGRGYLHEVTDLVHHPARRRRVLDLDRVVRPLEAEPAHRRAMILLAPRDALEQRDAHLLLPARDLRAGPAALTIPLGGRRTQ